MSSKAIHPHFSFYGPFPPKSVLSMSTEEAFAELIVVWRCTKDTSAREVADAASATWSNINSALSPIIGQHGVAALFKRSLHLQQINYPPLMAVRNSNILPGEFTAELHAFLTQQTNANAWLVNSAILNIFYELLTNLIGNSLTHQLLHSLFSAPSSGDPAQDISS
jgi:hypothetical protein